MALTVWVLPLVEPTSVRDPDAAVEVEPRGSLVCAACVRETVLLVETAVSSGKGRSALRPEGVGGGERKATFLGASLTPLVVLMLPLPALRELRPADSCSARGDAVRVTTAVSMDSSSATSERGPLEGVADMGL